MTAAASSQTQLPTQHNPSSGGSAPSAAPRSSAGAMKGALQGKGFAEQTQMLAPRAPGAVQLKAGGGGKTAKVSVEVVNKEFNRIWTNKYKRKPESIQLAAAETRTHFGAGLPDGWSPPPLRTQAKAADNSAYQPDASNSTPAPAPESEPDHLYGQSIAPKEKGEWEGVPCKDPNASPPSAAPGADKKPDDKKMTPDQQRQYETAKKYAPQGIMQLRRALAAVEMFPEYGIDDAVRFYEAFPGATKCSKDPDGDKRELDAYRATLPKTPKAPVASQGEKGDMERAKEQSAYRANILKDLEWAATNPIGSGTYGISRAKGNSHSKAMVDGKLAQGAFNIAGAHADGLDHATKSQGENAQKGAATYAAH